MPMGDNDQEINYRWPTEFAEKREVKETEKEEEEMAKLQRKIKRGQDGKDFLIKKPVQQKKKS